MTKEARRLRARLLKYEEPDETCQEELEESNIGKKRNYDHYLNTTEPAKF